MEGKEAIKGYAGPYRGRNDYYRDGSYILMLIVNFQAVVMVALAIAFAFYFCTRTNQDRYFAETADGRIIEMTAMESPNTERDALSHWASNAASDIMTFSFNDFLANNIHNTFIKKQKYFTPEGWTSFKKAMEASKLIDDVLKTQQIATAVPYSPAIVGPEGLGLDGVYQWTVDVPLLITFRAGSDIRPVTKTVHMVIEKMPTKENPSGIGISEWDLH